MNHPGTQAANQAATAPAAPPAISVFTDCCHNCSCVLTASEKSYRGASRHKWGQVLCFDCIEVREADNPTSRTPAGGEA